MKLSSQYIDILLSKCTEKETDNKFAHKKTRENAENVIYGCTLSRKLCVYYYIYFFVFSTGTGLLEGS